MTSPDYRAARHRGIGIAQSLKRNGVWKSACPRVVPKPAGVDDEGIDDGGRPFA
ncbi:MAG: hypothetical protein GDA36_13880 [Rhodobacteraceae bacterium]|nr:hypothetical protein [Paracoccaceae bacterium]